MDAKIQELTDRVYQDGVQKGRAEAERIVAEAKAEAERIVTEAKGKAEALLQDTERRMVERKHNTEAELRLYASQLIESSKGSLQDSLVGAIASSNVSAALADPEFMQAFILKIAEKFDLSKGVVIETADAEVLRAYFASNAKSLLDRGVEIRQVSGKATHFVVGPKDGSYKVQFGEGEFETFFRSFLRPQLAELLFQTQE